MFRMAWRWMPFLRAFAWHMEPPFTEGWPRDARDRFTRFFLTAPLFSQQFEANKGIQRVRKSDFFAFTNLYNLVQIKFTIFEVLIGMSADSRVQQGSLMRKVKDKARVIHDILSNLIAVVLGVDTKHALRSIPPSS